MKRRRVGEEERRRGGEEARRRGGEADRRREGEEEGRRYGECLREVERMRMRECKRLGGETRSIRESKVEIEKGLRRGGKKRIGESEK